MDEKRKAIEQNLKFLIESTLTKDEFLRNMEEIMKFLVTMQKKNEEEIESNKEMIAQAIDLLKGEATLQETKKTVTEMVEKMMSEHMVKMKAMDDKMAEVKNGDPGADADEEKVMRMVLKNMPPPPPPKIETPITLRDKLETLIEGEKLSIQAIEGLANLLEELGRKETRVVRGGGVGPLVRFIDDETLAGTVNGSNTDFTISKSPVSGSLKVYVNGQRMRVTEDYTLSNRTITFLTAPPTGSILLADFRY